MKRSVKIILITPIIFLFSLFLIRLISPTEIDDVSPEINCIEIEKYNPNVLYVIPNYNNLPISENKEWCNYILSLNKTLALHGINHEYREFLYEEITQEELNFAIEEFEKCFGFKPDTFKPPQLKISPQNKKLILSNNLKLNNVFHQMTHKVYHCGDSTTISNKIIHLF